MCTYEIHRKRPQSPRTISTKSMTVVFSPERNGNDWVVNSILVESVMCEYFFKYFFKIFTNCVIIKNNVKCFRINTEDFEDGYYPKHSTWTTLNNFKSPAPGRLLPSQRGRTEAQIFSWDLLQHTHFLFPLHIPWSIIKVTSTSQIHMTNVWPELPFMVSNGWRTTVLQPARSTAKQGHL